MEIRDSMMAVQSPPQITFGKFRHVENRSKVHRSKTERYATFSVGELNFVRPDPSISDRRPVSHSSPSSPRSGKQPKKGVLRIIYSKSRSMSFSPATSPTSPSSPSSNSTSPKSQTSIRLTPPIPPIDTFVPPPPPPLDPDKQERPYQDSRSHAPVTLDGQVKEAKLNTKIETDASLLALFPEEGPQNSGETEVIKSLSRDSPTSSDSSGTPSYRPRTSRFLTPTEPCAQLPVIPFPSPAPATHSTSFFTHPSQSQSHAQSEKAARTHDSQRKRASYDSSGDREETQTGLSQGRELGPEDDYYSSLWQSMKDESHCTVELQESSVEDETFSSEATKKGLVQFEVNREYKEIDHESTSDLPHSRVRSETDHKISYSRVRPETDKDHKDHKDHRDSTLSHKDDHSRRKERLTRIDNATYPPPPFQAHRLSYHSSHPPHPSLIFSKSHSTSDSQYPSSPNSFATTSPASSFVKPSIPPHRSPPLPSTPLPPLPPVSVDRKHHDRVISPRSSQVRPVIQSAHFRTSSHSVTPSEHRQLVPNPASDDEESQDSR